jgi:DNA-binding transcriptional ArsR family regulator
MEEKKTNGKQRAELVLHPVRLRIITALSSRNMTPGKLAEKLPDVPQATLYRHLKRLEKGGIIRIAATHHVRGTLEKVYSLGDPNKVNFSEEDTRNTTPAEHERYFTAFIAGLLHQFMNITDAAERQPELLNLLGYHTNQLTLDPTRLPQFQSEFVELLRRFSDDTEKPVRFQFTTILLPEVKHEPEH